MRTDRGLDRLTAFVDAVVAIAITLLVLPLVDVLPSGAPQESLGALLAGEWQQFLAFGLSFFVIAELWLAHHRLVELVGAYDGAFLVVNLLWVLSIVLLPFATQVTAVYGADRLAVAVYVGTMTLTSACQSALALLVSRRPALRRPGVDAGDVDPAASAVTTGLFAVALLLGVLSPVPNYLSLLLLFLAGPVRRVVARRATGAA
ncbi:MULTISPECIES: TMEM175 family protein [unclassified Geodermatophilus]